MKDKVIPVPAIENNGKQARNYFLLIFGLVFLIYGNSIKNGYALDDNYVTVTNPQKPDNARIAKGIAGIPEILVTHYVETKQQSFEYRPIPLITFAIEYQFFGSNPHISHFINVLLYALSCALLFSILLELFKTYNIVFPFLISLLFLFHSIHTEVVCNIKCRDELLAFLFGLCSWYFFLKGTDISKWKSLFLTCLFLLFALLCKKTAILFCALLPLTTYFFQNPRMKQFTIQVLIMLFIFVAYKLIERSLLSTTLEKRNFAFFENPLFYEPGFFNRLPAVFYTVGYYFKVLIFPFPLTCYYGYNILPVSGWTFFSIISAIFYLLMAIYASKKFKSKSSFSYGVLIFFIGISPFANLIDPVAGIVAERFIYFASLGFCVITAHALVRVFGIDIRNKSQGFKILTPFSKKVVTTILLLFAMLVVSRNSKWKDELTLLRNDTANFEESCNLHYLLGNTLYPEIFITNKGIKRDEMVREAISHYKKAVFLMQEGIKLYPTDFTTLSNIGTIYVNIFNDGLSAQPYFKRSLAINPEDLITQYNFVFCYEKRNLPDSAIAGYEKLVRNNTNYPLVYFRLHELYLQKKQYGKAIVCNEKAITQNPDNVRLYVNLGNALILNNDSARAIKPFMRAIELEPNNTELRNQIEGYLKLTGHFESHKN